MATAPTVVSKTDSKYAGKSVVTLSDGSKVRVNSKTGKSGSGSKNSIDTTSSQGLANFAAESANDAFRASIQAPVVPKPQVTPTTDATVIKDAAPQLNLATRPNMAADIAASVGSTGNTQAHQTQYDAEEQAQLNELQREQAKLAKYAESYDPVRSLAKLEKSQGIPDIRRQIQEANLQLADMQSEFQLQDQAVGNQAIPLSPIIGQQNELKKTAAIRINAQAAFVQALQGNLELTQHYVDKVLDLEFKDFTLKYQAKKDNIENLKDILKGTQAKQAQMISHQLDLEKTEFVSFIASKRETINNMRLNGAPAGSIKAATLATNTAELQSAAGRYAVDPIAQAELAYKRAQIDALYRKDGESEEEATQSSMQKVDSLKGKVQLIDSIINSKGMNGAVGSYWFTRTTPFSADKSARRELFAGVQQLISQETMDSLLNLKKAGGTLGALSESEQDMLKSAATKLNTWMIKDSKGNPTGKFEISQKDFTKELNRIRDLTTKAILEATPTTYGLDVVELDEIDAVYQGNAGTTSAFTPNKYY